MEEIKTTTQTTNPPTFVEKKKGNKLKVIGGCACITFALLFVCSGVMAFVWANGSFKQFVCNNSYKDSFFYNKLECSTSLSTLENKSVDQGKTIDLNLKNTTNTEELITQIVEETNPAIVTVVANTPADPIDIERGNLEGQKQNIGSGFVVRSDGVIITNSHVVDNDQYDYSVIIGNEKTPIPVKQIFKDSGNDIAILKVDKSNLSALKLGDSDVLKRGNLVIAIGSPLGDLVGTVSSGIVSGLNRDVNAGGSIFSQSKSYQGVIQTDAPINPGNSGGPLLNSKGEVIGVNFATTQGADNISFALPINRVKIKLNEYFTLGRLQEPFIGIAFNQRTYYLKDTVVTGALVTQIQPNTPASQSALQKGDLITEVNGKSMETNSLLQIIQTSKVDSTLVFKVLRKSQTIEISIKVGDKSKM